MARTNLSQFAGQRHPERFLRTALLIDIGRVNQVNPQVKRSVNDIVDVACSTLPPNWLVPSPIVETLTLGLPSCRYCMKLLL